MDSIKTSCRGILLGFVVGDSISLVSLIPLRLEVICAIHMLCAGGEESYGLLLYIVCVGSICSVEFTQHGLE